MVPEQLPAQAWAATPGGAALLAALEAPSGATRLVGGAVRDALLGLPVKDIDLATIFTPEDVIARLGRAGLKAVPTGLAHGTVTAVCPKEVGGLVAEVTTLRRDVATHGRHATVAFTDDWQADASRRDFTINALYASLPDGALSDWFGGRADLEARRVRFIGDPLQRIAEDHLRILRFFRFSARFAGALDADGLAACTARANDLMALSRERIAIEVKGLLGGAADPVPVLAEMLARGIWRPVLPELMAQRLPALARTIAAEAESGLGPAWQRRLAALLPAEAVVDVGARLRLANADRQRLALAVQPLASGDAAEAYRDGAPAVVDRLLIAGQPDAAAALAGWQRPKLPASGKDIIARGIAPGPEVARRLAGFERAWVAAGFPADGAAVAALLDQSSA
jgi:poly(A) polymerase